jgi:hypothetical protein
LQGAESFLKSRPLSMKLPGPPSCALRVGCSTLSSREPP